jgi:hypothetical protein
MNDRAHQTDREQYGDAVAKLWRDLGITLEWTTVP